METYLCRRPEDLAHTLDNLRDLVVKKVGGSGGYGMLVGPVECWFPDLGWIGLDPTNNSGDDERHIRVAVGRDYADVPPTRGVHKGWAESVLTPEVTVTRQEM